MTGIIFIKEGSRVWYRYRFNQKSRLKAIYTRELNRHRNKLESGEWVISILMDE